MSTPQNLTLRSPAVYLPGVEPVDCSFLLQPSLPLGVVDPELSGKLFSEVDLAVDSLLSVARLIPGLSLLCLLISLLATLDLDNLVFRFRVAMMCSIQKHAVRII